MPSANPAVDRMRPVLETMPVFAGLEERDAVRICESARMRRFSPGDIVIERGDPPDALYAVATGRLKVVSPRPGARDATLHILGPGDVFGEVSMFHPGGRTARIVTLEESVLMVIDRDAFLHLLGTVQPLAQRLFGLMAGRMSDIIAHFDEATSLGAAQRLARKLLLLARHFGRPTEDGVGLAIKLSQSDLGELADTTRQTVNQQLRNWEQEGVVRRRQGMLEILDEPALRGLAGLEG